MLAPTPAQDVVGDQLLLANEHGHNDEGVQVDALAQHPEVAGGEGVLDDHRQDLTADLWREGGRNVQGVEGSFLDPKATERDQTTRTERGQTTRTQNSLD